MTTPLPINDTTNNWIEDENTYQRKEDVKGNLDNTNGTYEKYVKRIVDISGKNNHLYIGPYKNYHVNDNGVSYGWLDPDNEYYGTLRPYTFYEANKKLDTNAGYAATHPDYNLEASVHGSFANPTSFNNIDVTMKDGTTGKAKDKYWTTTRWHSKQLAYWNEIIAKKNAVNLKSYIGDTKFASVSAYKDTIQHYPGSSTLVTQFSDAQLYDWTDDTQHGTKKLKAGTTHNLGIQQSNYDHQFVLMNIKWNNGSYSRYVNSLKTEHTWHSSQNNIKITWRDPVSIVSGLDYAMFGTATWSIKYNYGASTSNKSVFSAFTTTLNTFLDEDNNSITVSLDLGAGAQNCVIYQATETVLEDGIPFVNKGYYVICGTSNRIARVEATGRKFTRIRLDQDKNWPNYGFHEFTGYFPDDIDSIFSVADSSHNTGSTNNRMINIYPNPDNSGTPVNTSIRIYGSNTTKYLAGSGYLFDGQDFSHDNNRVYLAKNKTYTFDVSAIKTNNKIALSSSTSSYSSISGISWNPFTDSDTITVKATSNLTSNNFLINMGNSSDQYGSIKSNQNQGAQKLHFEQFYSGGNADVEYSSLDKVTIDFTCDGYSGQPKTGLSGTPNHVDLNNDGQDDWSYQHYKQKMIVAENVTNEPNQPHTSDNAYSYQLNEIEQNANGLSKGHAYIIGVTSKINLDQWSQNNSEAQLREIAYKRREFIIANQEHLISNHNPPRLLANADIASKNLNELRNLLHEDDLIVARKNLIYKNSDGVKYIIDNTTYDSSNDGVAINSNPGTFADYLIQRGRTFGYFNNYAPTDSKPMYLDLDLSKISNKLTADSQGNKYLYYFVYYQKGRSSNASYAPLSGGLLGARYNLHSRTTGGDVRFGRFLLSNPKPPHGGDASLSKGILINKFAARFAHPVGQYGFGNNTIEKGEGIKTFYMVCELFPSQINSLNNKNEFVLFDTAQPDHYAVELGYNDLEQNFHIKCPHITYTQGLSGTNKTLKQIIICAYFKVMNYLRYHNNQWQFGFYQKDGSWTTYSNIQNIVTSSNQTNSNIDSTNKAAGATFSVKQKINIAGFGQFLGNPEEAFTEAKKCDAAALNAAILAITDQNTGIDNNYKNFRQHLTDVSIIQIDQPEYLISNNSEGNLGMQSGQPFGAVPIYHETFEERDEDFLEINEFYYTHASRLANFIKQKAELNYSSSSYWVVDGTSAADTTNTFGKEVLIHLNKDYSTNNTGNPTRDRDSEDYNNMMSMLHFTDQNLEIRTEVDPQGNPTGTAPSPGPTVITMENLRRSSRLDTFERRPSIAGGTGHNFNTSYKAYYNQGTELIYEIFKDVCNSRNSAPDKATFIKEIDHIYRDILYSYATTRWNFGTQGFGSSKSRNLGRTYPKTVNGRDSLWSKGGGKQYAAYHTSRQYVSIEKSGSNYRPIMGDTRQSADIWINGKKYENGQQMHNISPANLSDTNGGKVLIVFKDKSDSLTPKLPPPNGINICGYAGCERQKGSSETYSNNVPRLNFSGALKTPTGFGLNYLAMYDTSHSETQIENNMKYLNQYWKIYNTNIGNWQYYEQGSIPTSGSEPTLPGELLFKYKADAKSTSGATNIVSALNGFALKQSDNTVGFNSSVTSYKLTVPYTVKTFTKNHLTVTLADPSSQPEYELSGDTNLVEGEEKTITIKTNSESRMNIINYTIVILRQTNIQFAQNKTAAAFGNDSATANTDVSSVSNGATKDTSGRLKLDNSQKLKLKNVFVLGGGSEIQKHRKMHAALTLFLVNARNNNSNFNKDKGLKLSKDTFDSSFTSKLKSGITDVVVYPVDAKPDFSGSSSEGAFIPFSDGETFTCSIDSSDVSIECITSTESSATGNYTISVPTRANISKVGGGSINWGTGSDELKIKNVQYNDSFNIYGKLITIGSVTFGGNSGSVRISEFDEFGDVATHQNEIVKIGNYIYQMTLSPNHANNFVTDHTFYDGSQATSYNTQSNIDYAITTAFESFSSDVQEAEFNINSTGNSSMTLKSNVTDISNSTFETIDSSINSTYKSTRHITIKNNNFETHQNLQHSNKANLTVDLHKTLDKYNNAAETKSYDKLDIHSHINKTTNIHTNLSKNLSNNHILNNKKNVNNTFKNETNLVHQDYNITIDNNRNTFINNTLTETLHVNSNINEIKYSNIDIHTTADRYAKDINLSHYKSKEVSTKMNETLQLHQQNTQNIYDVDTFSTNNIDSFIGGTGASVYTYNWLNQIMNFNSNDNNDLNNTFQTSGNFTYITTGSMISLNIGGQQIDVELYKANSSGQLVITQSLTLNYTQDKYYGFYQDENFFYTIGEVQQGPPNAGNFTTVTDSTYTKLSESSLNTIIDKNDLTTFKHHSNVNHKANHTNTIYGTSSQFGNTNYTNNNKKNQTLVTKDFISTTHGTNTQFINGESTESCKDNTLIFKGNNDQIVNGSFDLKTTGNIFFNSVGGLNISTNVDKSLDLNSNVCIKEQVIVSNIPYILNTTSLSSYITSDGDESNMLTINPIYSLVLIALDTNNTLAQTYMEQDLYCRVKLGPGKYNGQHIKLVLHPSFQTFFSNVNNNDYNTIEKRVANNLKTDIIVRIESFADVDDNEFVTADLILNRGGMCLNLIYVATNTNTGSISTNNVDHYRTSGVSATGSGYWMLIGNSFTS